jgi:hypothetical protein
MRRGVAFCPTFRRQAPHLVFFLLLLAAVDVMLGCYNVIFAVRRPGCGVFLYAVFRWALGWWLGGAEVVARGTWDVLVGGEILGVTGMGWDGMGWDGSGS